MDTQQKFANLCTFDHYIDFTYLFSRNDTLFDEEYLSKAIE